MACEEVEFDFGTARALREVVVHGFYGREVGVTPCIAYFGHLPEAIGSKVDAVEVGCVSQVFEQRFLP